MHEAAGNPALKKQLDYESLGGFVDWYSEKEILIAYNQDIESGKLTLDLGMLGDNGPFQDLHLTSNTKTLV